MNKKDGEEKSIDIFKSKLVPQCKILSEKEEKELLKRYNISGEQLPKIRLNDPVVKALGAKINDVIEFNRKNKTFGISKYYRIVGGANE